VWVGFLCIQALPLLHTTIKAGFVLSFINPRRLINESDPTKVQHPGCCSMRDTIESIGDSGEGVKRIGLVINSYNPAGSHVR
jgi:hypothetical protein